MPSPSLREAQLRMKAQIKLGSPAEERLNVYSEGYRVRMEEALLEVYEAVRHVLGRRAFSELSAAYVAAFPSREYNLSQVGRSLPGFLADWPKTRELSFLPDLARLEWEAGCAFHAADGPAMNAQEILSRAEELENARVIFQLWVRCVASEWPILDIWQARHRPIEEVNIPVIGRPQQVWIFRRGLEVHCELLDPLQYRLLSGLLAGRPLGEALESVVRASGGTLDPSLFTQWFGRWASEGAVLRLE